MRLIWRVLVATGVLVFAAQNEAFELFGPKWPEPTTTMNLPMPLNSDIFAVAFEEAAATWGAVTPFRLAVRGSTPIDPCQDPNLNPPGNGVEMSPTLCGVAWGQTTLAVTKYWSLGDAMVQAGILFNANKSWTVYSGSWRTSAADYRRVAVHELGHVIGLDHEDTTTAVMHSIFGAGDILETPQADDISGVLALYGPADPPFGEDHALQVDHNWQFVTLKGTFQQAPIVILGPPGYAGGDPGVVRVKDVTGSGFNTRFQEWLYLDGAHTQEKVPALVLEQGRRWLSDGSVWEVGSFNLAGTRQWDTHSFSQPFSAPPRLFLTIQTNNGEQAVAVRARNVSASGFEAALFEEEALNDGHTNETIGYLALYSPARSGRIAMGGAVRPYLVQRVPLDHQWTPVTHSTLRLEEEKSLDTETAHIRETVDVFILGPHLFAQPVSSNGGDPLALRRKTPDYGARMEWGLVRGVNQDWTGVPLAKHYINPVVIAKPVSSFGGDPGVIRMKDVSTDHFALRYQEWGYLDGGHVPEDVFYMAAELGNQNVAGLEVDAGKTTTTALSRAGDWTRGVFSAWFNGVPSVFTAIQTFNGGDTVTSRTNNVGVLGLDLAMDEAEAKNDGHLWETIGWIAVERGKGTTLDGRNIEVARKVIDHTETPIVFSQPTSHAYPVVVSDVMSSFGSDPIFIRYRAPTNTGITLYLQEEKSADDEMMHFLEDVSVFVAE